MHHTEVIKNAYDNDVDLAPDEQRDMWKSRIERLDYHNSKTSSAEMLKQLIQLHDPEVILHYFYFFFFITSSSFYCALCLQGPEIKKNLQKPAAWKRLREIFGLDSTVPAPKKARKNGKAEKTELSSTIPPPLPPSSLSSSSSSSVPPSLPPSSSTSSSSSSLKNLLK